MLNILYARIIVNKHREDFLPYVLKRDVAVIKLHPFLFLLPPLPAVQAVEDEVLLCLSGFFRPLRPYMLRIHH